MSAQVRADRARRRERGRHIAATVARIALAAAVALVALAGLVQCTANIAERHGTNAGRRRRSRVEHEQARTLGANRSHRRSQ